EMSNVCNPIKNHVVIYGDEQHQQETTRREYLHEDSEREENQEVEFDLRPSEWLGSFDKNDLPHKLHNFVQPLLRGRKLSSATSDETAGVEELVLILATIALFLD
ncbi:hypothetical protein Tco_0306327, partial [Tanacetum coccineum]